jgi:hypothetical protein
VLAKLVTYFTIKLTTIGESNRFLCHCATKALAVKQLEQIYGGNTIVDQKG